MRPTVDIHPFSVHGQPSDDGRSIRLWGRDHQGFLTMDAAVGDLPAGDVLIADKTIYASRYFDVAALVLSMQETLDGRGYYLIAASRARSSKLTGVGGRVLRGQVERSAVSTVKMYLEWVRDSLNAR